MRRKRKKRRGGLKIFFAVIILLLILTAVLVLNKTRIQLSLKGYTQAECSSLLELPKERLQEYLSYENAIDIEQWNTIENNRHYYDYELLKNTFGSLENTVNFVDELYSNEYDFLQANGYSLDTVRSLMKKFSLDDFHVLRTEHLSWEQLSPYLDIRGYILEDIPKYLESGEPAKEAVMNVSYGMINSAKGAFYDREYSLDEPDKLSLLIKRGFYVSEDYVPENLREVNIPNAPSNKNNMMREDAASALEEMYEDALKENLVLAVNSAYRSYEEQQEIYDEYFRIYDAATAASLVAVPGSSEHQLGLSVDLTSQSVINGEYAVFGVTPEYRWAVENAHKYGFILRYPDGKTDITGIANEPWHFRYVGKELAGKLYEEKLTLEEYTMKYGFDYEVSLREKTQEKENGQTKAA